MALVGECRGWDVETEMLSQWRERADLFPRVPSQSRFNRRRRGLMNAFNVIRQTVVVAEMVIPHRFWHNALSLKRVVR